MTLVDLFHNPAGTVVFLLAIALAIGVHEAAHATVADRLGDNTAKLLGRTSINPLVHLDLLGTLLFLFAGFGWGKPVPVDEDRLNHRFDILWVALAGPASNFGIAIVLGLLLRFLPGHASLLPLRDVLATFVYVNLSLMIFNLIPIPPLDGSKVLRFTLSAQTYFLLERYGLILVFAVFMLTNGVVGTWLTQAVQLTFRTLTGTV